MRYKLEQMIVLLIYFTVSFLVLAIVIVFVVMFLHFMGIINHVRVR